MKKYIIPILVLAVVAIVGCFVWSYARTTTGRIDFETALVDATTPQFEIYVDGSETSEKQAGWMNKYETQGYSLQRRAGAKDIKLKALTDANVKITLRGIWEKDPEGKMVEHWVKYTSLVIDGKEILTEPVDVWHNKPFSYTLDAKAGQNYNIRIKWKKSEK